MRDNIYLRPIAGTFDVERIRAWLEAQGDVLLDPRGTGIYMICGFAESKRWYREQRMQEPERFPYVVLVTVEADCVHVQQEFGDEHRLRNTRSFVRWLLGEQSCRIEDEYGTDWTERVAREGVGVLYPATLT